MEEFKKDKFTRTRGGHSKWFLVCCEKCHSELFYYQKDGPGILKRVYIDRIFSSKKIKRELICNNCKTLLGVLITYKKEKRLAYRLFVGAVTKKITSSSKIKEFAAKGKA